MGKDWMSLPPPPTLGDIYLQPTAKNQRSRLKTLRRWRSTKPPVRDWAGLQLDILSYIFQKLTAFDILWPVQAVCRSWHQVALQPHVWRRIDMRNHPEPLYPRVMKKLAMEAFDRSGGIVEEFYAEDIGSDDLLSYMAERTTGLRCLVLISPSYGLSVEGLSKIASRFLEVLEITSEDRQLLDGPLGPSFEGLKFFRLNTTSYDRLRYEYIDNEYYYDCNKEAMEIAKCMPNLCELQLIGNRMTNIGLHAILDNCLHLEVLDIQECHNVSLDDFMKNKLGKIKTVRLPQAPTREDKSNWMLGYRGRFRGWVYDRESSDYYDSDYYDFPDSSSDYYDCDDYDFRVSSWEGTGLKLQRKAYASLW